MDATPVPAGLQGVGPAPASDPAAQRKTPPWRAAFKGIARQGYCTKPIFSICAFLAAAKTLAITS